MTEYYCKCVNVCLLTEDSPSPVQFLGRNNLPEDERNHEFFKQLPLLVTRIAEVKREQPLLVELEKIGSWIVYKCINCLTYIYATSKTSPSVLMNNSLSQITAEEFQNIKDSPDFSSVYRILIMDYSTPRLIGSGSSQALGEYYNDKVLEIKRQLVDSVEKKKKNTEELIQKFVDEQQNLLKEYIVRANNDFQVLKDLLSNRENEPTINSYQDQANESTYQPPLNETNIRSNDGEDPPDNNTIVSQMSDTDRNWDKDILCATDIPPSLDSEGVFPLDGMENNTILEDDDHSEDDLSDTDDSGSRDEGIHIPRRKSVAFARSLPIRVPSDFGASLRVYDDRHEESKSKPNYKSKRNERPLDIAASIQALANSVHGDAIFGDLPRRKAGFRI